MYNVIYNGGESRYVPGKTIDYMVVEVDGVELYAEIDVEENNELGSYGFLKDEILDQADANGIPRTSLRFFYDD